MRKKKHLFLGFGKPGEKAEEKRTLYLLSGKGTDLGCVLLVQEEINRPSLLGLEIKGTIKKMVPWARLRIEIFDKENIQIPATSFEEQYLTDNILPDQFKSFSFPILGIVKRPHKVQVMVVGPSETNLEIRNVSLR